MLGELAEGNLDLLSPWLIIAEVGNTLRTAASRGIVKPEEAREMFLEFLELGVGRLDITDEDQGQVLDLSMRIGMSFYDGAYIQMSKKHGVTLLSADDPQIKAAKGEVETLHLRNFKKMRYAGSAERIQIAPS